VLGNGNLRAQQKATQSFTVAVNNSYYVSLSWTASVTAGVSGYYVYRSSVSGGPYTKLNPTAVVAGTTYTDLTVQLGKIYYYVVTAVDPSDTIPESGYSNEVSTTIPSS
jgi:fibronectin type 3 domain-containing protein